MHSLCYHPCNCWDDTVSLDYFLTVLRFGRLSVPILPVLSWFTVLISVLRSGIAAPVLKFCFCGAVSFPSLIVALV